MSERRFVVAVFNEAQKWSLPEEPLHLLRDRLPPTMTMVSTRSRAQLLEELPHAECLMGLPLAESQFAGQAPNVKFVQLVTAWAASLAPYEAALLAGARVAGTAEIRAEPVAEHAVTLLLTLLKRMDLALAAQSARRWAAMSIARETRDLKGATVGILNLGASGRAIAARLAPFGCELIATAAGGTGDAEKGVSPVARLLPPGSADEVVSRSDILILADDPPRDKGRVNPTLTRALFESMRPHTLLINVASGSAFAEAELLRAIRRGRLAGAALDCFEHRPLSPTSPLWNAPNIILTPSIATASPAYWRRVVEITIENLRRFQSDEPLIDEMFLPAPANTSAVSS